MKAKIVISIGTLMCLLFPCIAMAENPDADHWYQKGLNSEGLNAKIECFTQALKLDPENPRIHNSIGIVYIQKGLYDLAISHLRKAAKLDRTYLDAFINLGIAVRAKGDPKQSIDIYNQVLAQDPNSVFALYNQAIAYESIKDYTKAIQNYLKAMSLDPDNRKVWLNLGVAYFRSGQAERGIQLLQTLIEKYPDYGKAHYDLGMIYANTNKVSESKYHFRKAAEMGIPVPSAYTVETLGSQEQPASREYERWIPPTLIPTSAVKIVATKPASTPTAVPVSDTPTPVPEPTFKLTAETQAEPKPEIAATVTPEEKLETSTPVPRTGQFPSPVPVTKTPIIYIENPKPAETPAQGEFPPEYWYNKALQEQNPDKREYYFKRALQTHPDFEPALLELANLYLVKAQNFEQNKNLEESRIMAVKAADQYEKYLKSKPDASKVYLNLGVIYAYYLNNPEKAIFNWEKFLQLNPTSDRADQIKAELKKLKKAK